MTIEEHIQAFNRLEFSSSKAVDTLMFEYLASLPREERSAELEDALSDYVAHQ